MRVVAATHGRSVGPGVFEEAVRSAGHELVEWQVPLGGSPVLGDALIVFGGGMHPDEESRHDWLGPELRYLSDSLEQGTPVFGVCLGSQLLARAAGARVYRAEGPEIGWLQVDLTPAGGEDAVAAVLPERFDAFQWHHYTHELPSGSVELARSRVCIQAWRLGNAWGVQFHPEVRAAQVEAWLAEEPHDVEDSEALLAATRTRITAWNELGARLCGAFLHAASKV